MVLGDNTLVIMLHGALSQAERALAQTPAGATQVQEFHRQLFQNCSESLRQDIKRITGVEVRDATAEGEPKTGTIVQVFSSGTGVQVFSSGTGVQVFLLDNSVPAGRWSDVVRKPRI